MTARLRIRTRQTAEGERSEDLRTALGVYRPAAEGWQLTYPEGEGVTAVLTAAPGEVTVTRRGALSSRLVFRPGERTMTAYRTPYGVFDLAVTTHALFWDLSPAGGRIRLSYTLTFGGGDTHTEVLIDLKTV